MHCPCRTAIPCSGKEERFCMAIWRSVLGAFGIPLRTQDINSISCKKCTSILAQHPTCCRQRHSNGSGRTPAAWGLYKNPGRALSGMFAETDSGRTKDRRSDFANDPMDFGTPDAGSVAPRMYTQDSYKEDQGKALSILCTLSFQTWKALALYAEL